MIAVTTTTMPDGTPQGPWHPTVADFRAYVERHQARMLHHAAQAVAASNEWRQRDAELAKKFEAMRLGRFEIADRKGSDPDLSDAWSAYSFHSGKAQLHASVLQGLAAARSLLTWTNNKTAASLSSNGLADGADVDGAVPETPAQAGGGPVDHAAPAPAVPVEPQAPGTAGVTPDRAASHLGLVGTVRDDDGDDDGDVPVQPVPPGVVGYQVGSRRPTIHPHGHVGEADARLATAVDGAAVREAPTGVAAPVGAAARKVRRKAAAR